jgi:lipopolysaccharide export system permease protein
MKRTIQVILFGLWALAASVSCSGNRPAAAPSAVGVWADRDCELLRTERFALLFESNGDTTTSLLQRMDATDTVLLGKTVFTPDSVLMQYVHRPGEARQYADPGAVQPDGRLRIVVEGRERMLEKIESFAVSAPYEMLKASPLEIGSCIQQWSLGTRCRCENGSISFEAGTNRHSYTFNIEPGFVYCRAARLRFNERGGLFAQNIRMMANAREHTAYMAPDNRAESAEPLKIDDSKFSPDQCVFDEDGIYWSFIRFEGDSCHPRLRRVVPIRTTCDRRSGPNRMDRIRKILTTEEMKMRFPGFKILDRYILGKFLSTYFFAIAMIIVIVVVFDYVEKIDDFTELHAPLKSVILDYYLNFIPYFINQFSGLFTFIACIFFTSKMAYQTEIVAMLSGGMSFRRLMWPYFLGALIIASLSLTLNLWLIPISQRHIVAFEQQYIKRKQNTKYDRHIYRQIEPGIFAYIRGYNDGARQASFFVLERYESGTMTHSLEASDAKFNPETKRWTAPRYTKREFDSAGTETFEQFRNLDTLINLEATELGEINDLIQTMNISELNAFLDQQRAKGSDSINLIEVEKHARYAYPLSTFILTLIGVSLSSRKVRGGTGLHIGIGTGLCFSYILFNRFFEEFAKSGTLPPGLAVWLPNIIYLGIAVYLYRKAPK